MIVRRKGGLTEFIPTPQEKRDGLIRDHALGLLENLHQRLARLERASKLPTDEAEAFTALLARMRADESRNLELHASLITSDTASADWLTATANPNPDTANRSGVSPSVRRQSAKLRVIENKRVKCRLWLFFYLICVRKEAFIHGVSRLKPADNDLKRHERRRHA